MHCMMIPMIHKNNTGSVHVLVESLNGILLDLLYKVIYPFSFCTWCLCHIRDKQNKPLFDFENHDVFFLIYLFK